MCGFNKKYFVGRTKELEFISNIRDNQSSKSKSNVCAIVGPRQIGKTTLLKEFVCLSRAKGFNVVYLNFAAFKENPDIFFNLFFKTISRALKKSADNEYNELQDDVFFLMNDDVSISVSRKIGGLAKKLAFRKNIPRDAVGYPGNFFLILRSILEADPANCIIIFDEFQKVRHQTECIGIKRFMRELNMDSRRNSGFFLFSGFPKGVLLDSCRRFAVMIPEQNVCLVQPFDKRSSNELAERLGGAGKELFFDEIYKRSGGIPVYVREISSRLWKELSLSPDKKCLEPVQVIDSIIYKDLIFKKSQISLFCNRIFAEVQSKEKQLLLLELACGEKKNVRGLCEHFNVSGDSLKNFLNDLEKEYLIQDDNGVWSLKDPIFLRWLLLNKLQLIKSIEKK